MHPVLFENWYELKIGELISNSLGGLIGDLKLYYTDDTNGNANGEETRNHKCMVDIVNEYINNIDGLRFKSRADNCHHCAKIKGNTFDYYNRLCWDCGLRAWQIRNKSADLKNIRMCVTGCRHTVGLTITLRALRQGAFVLGTTRFPNLALAAYKLKPDYHIWQDRLIIIGADFTKYPDIQKIISALAEYRINCYINNAFQTMPNTPNYIMNARTMELTPPSNLEELTQLLDCNGNIRPLTIKSDSDPTNVTATSIANSTGAPNAPNLNASISVASPQHNSDLSLIKHRFGVENSWKQPIAKITHEEIITAGMVNQIAPALIINVFRQLAPYTYSNVDFPYQVIINVGSSEGDDNVQASITGGHKNHMQKIIECLRAEKDPNLIAYTSDPGFITGVFGKSNTSIINPDIGLVKVLTADDGGARILWPLIDFINNGDYINATYRG